VLKWLQELISALFLLHLYLIETVPKPKLEDNELFSKLFFKKGNRPFVATAFGEYRGKRF
jgi:hypothetical protein